MANTDIPSFNDICGTVTQALAETIINREAVIAQLRDELARTKDLLRERSTNYGELAKQNAELHKEIEGWREECEIHERDNKELYRLQEAIRPLKTENIRITAQRDQFKSDCERLRAERDEARRDYCEYVAEDRRQGLIGHEETTPDAVALEMGWSVFSDDRYTPSLFEKSDSDPVTGVQYGDLA